MKAFSASVIFCLLVVQTQAQKIPAHEVPAIVKDAFNKTYAWKDVQWSKEERNFEAEFKQGGRNISVVLNTSGDVIEVETEIRKKELPVSILHVLKRDYSTYEFEEFAKIESGGSLTYEVEVEKNEQSFDLIFNADGTLIEKKTKVDSEDRDD
jgi:hypothetical protein